LKTLPVIFRTQISPNFQNYEFKTLVYVRNYSDEAENLFMHTGWQTVTTSHFSPNTNGATGKSEDIKVKFYTGGSSA
jgi:hypothetical protein